ncbi:MAG: Zn-ribbon domain-containing OB-fold protein [Streptosporangiales bacterium]
MSELAPLLAAPNTGDRQRVDDVAGRLVGGRCAACGTVTWPRRAACPRCVSGDVADANLPTQGTLVTVTTVWVPVEGIEPPYTLGLVRLGGAEVFAHIRGLDDAARVPVPVVLRLDREASPPFWFVPRQ